MDLAGAETLGEIVEAFNNQAFGVTAAINSARNGIVLTDTTGATASNLIIADGDSNNTATALRIVANTAATTKNSGSLATVALMYALPRKKKEAGAVDGASLQYANRLLLPEGYDFLLLIVPWDTK